MSSGLFEKQQSSSDEKKEEDLSFGPAPGARAVDDRVVVEAPTSPKKSVAWSEKLGLVPDFFGGTFFDKGGRPNYPTSILRRLSSRSTEPDETRVYRPPKRMLGPQLSVVQSESGAWNSASTEYRWPRQQDELSPTTSTSVDLDDSDEEKEERGAETALSETALLAFCEAQQGIDAGRRKSCVKKQEETSSPVRVSFRTEAPPPLTTTTILTEEDSSLSFSEDPASPLTPKRRTKLDGCSPLPSGCSAASCWNGGRNDNAPPPRTYRPPAAVSEEESSEKRPILLEVSVTPPPAPLTEEQEQEMEHRRRRVAQMQRVLVWSKALSSVISISKADSLEGSAANLRGFFGEMEHDDTTTLRLLRQGIKVRHVVQWGSRACALSRVLLLTRCSDEDETEVVTVCVHQGGVEFVDEANTLRLDELEYVALRACTAQLRSALKREHPTLHGIDAVEQSSRIFSLIGDGRSIDVEIVAHTASRVEISFAQLIARRVPRALLKLAAMTPPKLAQQELPNVVTPATDESLHRRSFMDKTNETEASYKNTKDFIREFYGGVFPTDVEGAMKKKKHKRSSSEKQLERKMPNVRSYASLSFSLSQRRFYDEAEEEGAKTTVEESKLPLEEEAPPCFDEDPIVEKQADVSQPVSPQHASLSTGQQRRDSQPKVPASPSTTRSRIAGAFGVVARQFFSRTPSSPRESSLSASTSSLRRSNEDMEGSRRTAEEAAPSPPSTAVAVLPDEDKKSPRRRRFKKGRRKNKKKIVEETSLTPSSPPSVVECLMCL